MPIDAVMWYFSCSKARAKQIIKERSKECIDDIVRFYNHQCHLAFYED